MNIRGRKAIFFKGTIKVVDNGFVIMINERDYDDHNPEFIFIGNDQAETKKIVSRVINKYVKLFGAEGLAELDELK